MAFIIILHTDISLQRYFYFSLPPMKGALEALQEIVGNGIQVLLCSSVPSSSTYAAQEKIDWVRHNLGPEWISRVVLSSDLTSIRGDVLVTDKTMKDIKFKSSGVKAPIFWEQVLFKQPYNRKADKSIKRMNHWFDWPDVLLPLLNKKLLLSSAPWSYYSKGLEDKFAAAKQKHMMQPVRPEMKPPTRYDAEWQDQAKTVGPSILSRYKKSPLSTWPYQPRYITPLTYIDLPASKDDKKLNQAPFKLLTSNDVADEENESFWAQQCHDNMIGSVAIENIKEPRSSIVHEPKLNLGQKPDRQTFELDSRDSTRIGINPLWKEIWRDILGLGTSEQKTNKTDSPLSNSVGTTGTISDSGYLGDEEVSPLEPDLSSQARKIQEIHKSSHVSTTTTQETVSVQDIGSGVVQHRTATEEPHVAQTAIGSEQQGGHSLSSDTLVDSTKSIAVGTPAPPATLNPYRCSCQSHSPTALCPKIKEVRKQSTISFSNPHSINSVTILILLLLLLLHPLIILLHWAD